VGGALPNSGGGHPGARVWGRIVIFVVSKLVWQVVAPGNLLLLVLVAGVIRMAWSRGRRGFGLVATATAGFLVIAMLPIGPWLVAPLENRFPTIAAPARVDGIV